MQYINYKWLEEPEKLYPEPKTLVNAIKWHLAIKAKYNSMFHELNSDTYDKNSLACMADFKTSPEIQSLIDRDNDYMCSLGYPNMARIEAAMMIGRELWYKKRNGCTEYEPELKEIKLSDLDAWMKVFEIPPTITEGGNIDLAAEYTLGKRPEFLRMYVDALEGVTHG